MSKYEFKTSGPFVHVLEVFPDGTRLFVFSAASWEEALTWAAARARSGFSWRWRPTRRHNGSAVPGRPAEESLTDRMEAYGRWGLPFAGLPVWRPNEATGADPLPDIMKDVAAIRA